MQETGYIEQNNITLKLSSPKEEHQSYNGNCVSGIDDILSGINIFKIPLYERTRGEDSDQ